MTVWGGLSGGVCLGGVVFTACSITVSAFIWPALQDDITLNPLRRVDTTPAKKRFAITPFFLAQGDHYQSIATTLGIHKSSVSKHLHAVMPMLERKLFARNVKLPANRELLQLMADFESLCGLPQCAGAIDGCFIPMETPTGISDKYWCYKNIHAIISLVVVDAKGIFTSVSLGQPASVGDAAITCVSDTTPHMVS